MNSFRPLRWAIAMILALVCAAGAQNTSPVSTEFDILSVPGGIELIITQGSGTILPEEGVTIRTNRPDTLPELTLSASIIDTIRDSTQTIAALSFVFGGNHETFRDTFPIDDFVYWPQYKVHGVDSLFAINFSHQSPVLFSSTTKADQFTITLRHVIDPALYVASFAQDTVKGTSTDTSKMIYLGGKVKSVQFGIKSSGATPEINYMALYNNGFGWGQTTPSDTIMLATETVIAAANIWKWVDGKDIMAAQWLKVIRVGTAAADTLVLQEHFRLERSD